MVIRVSKRIVRDKRIPDGLSSLGKEGEKIMGERQRQIFGLYTFKTRRMALW